jgi:aspartate 1-decarboxylase
MFTCLLKSKIHRATVTAASVDYEGSLTIAADLAQRVGLRAYERILVGNLANGERFETYVIHGKPKSGAIELNGATAHLGAIGDKLTIMSFAWVDAEAATRHVPAVIVLGDRNAIVRESGPISSGPQASGPAH